MQSDTAAMEEAVANLCDSAADYDQKSRPSKKPATRPAMQIYRPPGLRSGGAAHSPPDSQRENGAGTPPAMQRESAGERETPRQQPGETAGRKPSQTSSIPRMGTPPGNYEENNNHRKSPPQNGGGRLNRTESNLSSESAISQKSSGAASLGSAGDPQFPGDRLRPKKGPTPPRAPKEKPKKIMTPKEVNDAATAFRSLNLSSNTAELEQLIASDFGCEQSAECLGSSLAQHAIEGGAGCSKQVTKACSLIRESAAFGALARGLLNSIAQYYDCRDRLRHEHFRMWIAFLNFVSDLYSNIGGTPTGELVNVVFQVFDFLLRAPVLDALKIEELESLISSLLTIGYDLERDSPDRLSALKDLIRDAFIEVHEPWARKMILLLLELGASGWKLPPEANEYYFQQGNN